MITRREGVESQEEPVFSEKAQKQIRQAIDGTRLSEQKVWRVGHIERGAHPSAEKEGEGEGRFGKNL